MFHWDYSGHLVKSYTGNNYTNLYESAVFQKRICTVVSMLDYKVKNEWWKQYTCSNVGGKSCKIYWWNNLCSPLSCIIPMQDKGEHRFGIGLKE